jgi:hypothetical protein
MSKISVSLPNLLAQTKYVHPIFYSYISISGIRYSLPNMIFVLIIYFPILLKETLYSNSTKRGLFLWLSDRTLSFAFWRFRIQFLAQMLISLARRFIISLGFSTEQFSFHIIYVVGNALLNKMRPTMYEWTVSNFTDHSRLRRSN